MLNVYLDTNILIASGIAGSPFYEKLKILHDANILNVYVHEYIIEEYKNHVLFEYSNLLNKSKEIVKLKNTLHKKHLIKINIDTCAILERKEIAEVNINEFFLKYGLIKLNAHTDSHCLTLKDYFNLRNAFKHEIIDKPKREKIKKNFIDSMIAHTYLENFGNKNILITKNIKDFEWMQENDVKLDFYTSLKEFFKETGDSYIEQINRSASKKSIRDLFDNQSFVDNLKDLVLEMLQDTVETIDINPENFDHCINQSVEFSTYCVDDPRYIILYEPILQENGKYFDITVSFKIMIKADVVYAALVSDLIETGVLDFNIHKVGISQRFQDVFEIHDYPGEEVIVVSQIADVEVVGYLNAIFISEINATSAERAIEFLRNKAKLVIQNEEYKASQ